MGDFRIPPSRVEGVREGSKTFPLRGTLLIECHSLNMEARELELCLGSLLSEKGLLDKGEIFAGIPEISWRGISV